jgi:hypothetical protein
VKLHALGGSLIAFAESNGVTLIVCADELNRSSALFVADASHCSHCSFNLPSRPIVQIGNAVSYTFADSHGRHDSILRQLPQRPRADRQATRRLSGVNENRGDFDVGFPIHHTSIPQGQINSGAIFF